jgi:hypoxanthine phosphoribosyltransferase
LVDKNKPRKESGIENADFKGLTIDDVYIFGYGLDYKGYLRNAPGIYAVAPEHR